MREPMKVVDRHCMLCRSSQLPNAAGSAGRMQCHQPLLPERRPKMRTYIQAETMSARSLSSKQRRTLLNRRRQVAQLPTCTAARCHCRCHCHQQYARQGAPSACLIEHAKAAVNADESYARGVTFAGMSQVPIPPGLRASSHSKRRIDGP